VTNQPATREKFKFIEGARGLASLQVLVLHYFSAFLPAFIGLVGSQPHYSWENWLRKTPVFFLIDGNTAVFVFFLMSGFVLAPAFTRSTSGTFALVAKRFVRLYIPVGVAVILSIAMVISFPDLRAHVSSLTHSQWINELYRNPRTIALLAKDLFTGSMLLGYQGVSILSNAGWLTRYLDLSGVSYSMDPPLWTLHAEFWGSMLLIVTAWLYTCAPRRLFKAVFVLMFFLTGTSYFTLFLLGFAAYMSRNWFLKQTSRRASLAGAVLIVTGILVCSTKIPVPYEAILKVCARFSWLHAFGIAQLKGQLGAIFLLSGVLLSAGARSFLSHRIPLWLGKISFSLYLIHFPIIFTFGFGLFNVLAPHTSYAIAIVTTTVISCSLTIAVAAAFERFVDRPSVVCANWSARHVTKLHVLGLINRPRLATPAKPESPESGPPCLT
jgi:peptidoglycan/LPS O-acetylase OafA/YrhL